MSSKDPFNFPRFVARAAANIPLDRMMTVCPDEARKLARRFRGLGMSEREILAALIQAVRQRVPGSADFGVQGIASVSQPRNNGSQTTARTDEGRLEVARQQVIEIECVLPK